MKDKMEIFNKYSDVPQNAQKEIKGGRINGFTDINPMWRIKSLTEAFGVCGFGWYYEVTRQWLESGANNEVSAFCNINLYVKIGEEWSKPIFGTGGSSFIANQKSGLNTSDEAFKMALTDAISVACKSLGFGSNIYWAAGRTKYDVKVENETKVEPKAQEEVIPETLTDREVIIIETMATKKNVSISAICQRYHVQDLSQLTSVQYVQCIKALEATA